MGHLQQPRHACFKSRSNCRRLTTYRKLVSYELDVLSVESKKVCGNDHSCVAFAGRLAAVAFDSAQPLYASQRQSFIQVSREAALPHGHHLGKVAR